MANLIKLLLIGAVAGSWLGVTFELGTYETYGLTAALAVLCAVFWCIDAGVLKKRRRREEKAAYERQEITKERFEEMKKLLTLTAEGIKKLAGSLDERAERQEKESVRMAREFLEELKNRNMQTLAELKDQNAQTLAELKDQNAQILAELKALCSEAASSSEKEAAANDEMLRTLEEVKSALLSFREDISDRLSGMENVSDRLLSAEQQICDDYKELQNSYIKEMVKLSENAENTVRLLTDSYRYLNRIVNER